MSGKRELNVVENDLLELVRCLSMYECEATSAILFCSPGIPMVSSGEVWCTCRRVARALRRWPVLMDDVLFN